MSGMVADHQLGRRKEARIDTHSTGALLRRALVLRLLLLLLFFLWVFYVLGVEIT